MRKHFDSRRRKETITKSRWKKYITRSARTLTNAHKEEEGHRKNNNTLGEKESAPGTGAAGRDARLLKRARLLGCSEWPWASKKAIFSVRSRSSSCTSPAFFAPARSIGRLLVRLAVVSREKTTTAVIVRPVGRSVPSGH